MKGTGWLKGLEVTAGGTRIVSHAGLALLRALADRTGLTGGLPEALASDQLLAHDRRRRRLTIAATWPWAPAIVTAWDRITALPQAP